MIPMKRFIVFAVTLGLTMPVIADELQGLWLSQNDAGKPTGYINITEDNGVYQGVIAKGLETDKEEKFCTACKDERKDKRLIGMTVLKEVVKKSEGSYEGAEILDPFSGNTYRVKLKLKDEGKILDVRGYVGVSLFGRTQTWKRAQNGK